ncbi:MAG: hypothetical protein R3F54_00645 [Alphaproteobacteria bacterium]
MYRRHLFKLAALPLASFALTLSGWRPLRADAMFRDLFGDDRLAAGLGRLYQQQDPQAGRRGLSLVAELASIEPSARERRLLARRQTELAALDVVTIDGWVLARSEADLCAAVHLDGELA